jgi:peptidoglycan hydrolase CwlO-like protein
MSLNASIREKPEEAELLRKQEELQHLEEELVDRELALASLKADLSSFEGQYLRRVGVLYAELDEIEAKIAVLLAKRTKSDKDTQRATEAREKAKASYSAAHGEASKQKEFIPSPELKHLYREVAKRIHPDLATDEADRLKRGSLMAQANDAYEQGDEERLRRILNLYESSPDSVQGDGVALDLVRTIRKISRVKERLKDIETEIEELAKSELSKMKKMATDLEVDGRNLIEEMAEKVRSKIEVAQVRIESLTQSA